MMPPVPVATYRLQLTPRFGFDAAAELVPYLKSLGVSHLYASPFFKARPGSTHGYDIVDHAAFNPELGGEAGFQRLSDALARFDMGLIVDFVPNHMCVEGVRNEWWENMLEFGPEGRHAPSFDISWKALDRRRGRLLLPVLGRPYGECLKQGELQLEYAESRFSVAYFDHRFPIRPDCYGVILRTLVAEAGAQETTSGRKLLKIADGCAPRRRLSEAETAKLKTMLAGVKGGSEVIEQGLAAYRVGSSPASSRRLHRLLERQHYRLAFWRLAGSEINYRRFFDINHLAGVRIERPETFQAVHRLVARLLSEGRLHGMRIDHIDGLLDPAKYCSDLQQLIRRHAKNGKAIYVVVEKILGEGENLPHWPGVAGTTGYEWLNPISRVLVDAEGVDRLEQCWRSIAPDSLPFDDTLRAAKSLVLDTLFGGDFRLLAQMLVRIAAGHRSTRDYAADHLSAALRAFIVEFPVYRTYIADSRVSPADRARIDRTIERARDRWKGPDPEVFDFLRTVLTLDAVRVRRGYSAARVRRFVMKLQQLTGPVMAKSLEDTALYRDHRLLALNEVGNEPTLPALSVAEFHQRMSERAAKWPHGLTTTATHDTKRGEDARMRILAIAEIAEDWSAAVTRWRRWNERHAESVASERAPSDQHEYMLYQALVGCWQADPTANELSERLTAYSVKAAREGKQKTSWLNPDAAYETAFGRFIERILDPARSGEFLDLFGRIAERCALLGALNSLSQLVLKLTMPGVPDLYQGTEFWDLSLVDPDNRRGVDFGRRKQALAEVGGDVDWNELADHWFDGRVKLALAARLLKARHRHSRLLRDGDYQAVETGDPERAVAFRRSVGDTSILAIAGRGFAKATDGGRRWPNASDWKGSLRLDKNAVVEDLLCHREVRPDNDLAYPVATLFGRLPVAVLLVKTARE